MKQKTNKKIEILLLGFAAGVMVAASIWSLLLPAIEMAEDQNKIAWVPASIGFFLGIIFLIVLDLLINKLKQKSSESQINKNTKMMILAVTLHNIPEGMAVGVAFAGALNQSSGITIFSALALAIGIGIQHIPVGAIISMPLKGKG